MKTLLLLSLVLLCACDAPNYNDSLCRYFRSRHEALQICESAFNCRITREQIQDDLETIKNFPACFSEK